MHCLLILGLLASAAGGQGPAAQERRCSTPAASGLALETDPAPAYLLQRGRRAVRIDDRGNDDFVSDIPGSDANEVPDCEGSEASSEPCLERLHSGAPAPPGSGATAPAQRLPGAGGGGEAASARLRTGDDLAGDTIRRTASAASDGGSKVGINLSTKWMAKPLPPFEAISRIVTIQKHLGLSKPIQRVKTFDLSPSNVEIINAIAGNAFNIKELVIGIGNFELGTFDVSWLQGVASRFGGAVHIAVGNEPDREGVHGSLVRRAIGLIKHAMPQVQVTVPFAYSIMGRSYPVDQSELRKEFLDEYQETLTVLDYLTINIYPFLSAGAKNVPLEKLKGADMDFLSSQLDALRVALDGVPSSSRIPIAIGETGWPSCGAARWHPYNFAVLTHSQEYMQNVAHWIESEASSKAIIAGYLFTAFDEETKGTREIERHYGILASDGNFKRSESCTSNATEPSVAWLEVDYPDCESDLDWMVKNFENAGLMEKFTNRGIDGSLCSFQQYLSDRWASCPPITRIPGQAFFDGAHMAYGTIGSRTKCNSGRLATKYSDRGPTSGPSYYRSSPKLPERGLPGLEPVTHSLRPGPTLDSVGPPAAAPQAAPWTAPQAAPQAAAVPLAVAPVAVKAKTGSAVLANGTVLKVFWINLDASTDRRSAMEDSLKDLSLEAVRVPAVTASDVGSMVRNGSLSVEAQLIGGCTLACPTHHQRGELLATEMAVTLSHLRAISLAHAAGNDMALILEDDARVYGELLTDLNFLLQAAPAGWNVLQLATVSTKALLLLASTPEAFRVREDRFYGTGAYLIRRSGMEHLLSMYASRRFVRSLSPEAPGASSLQAEPLIFGALPPGTVHTATRFYVNFAEFPTTVHVMAKDSAFQAVNSITWQVRFLQQHRGRSLRSHEPRRLDELASRLPTGGRAARLPSFLAMTTLVCRRNPSFFGEVNSIVHSINALEAYHFNWTIFAIIQDKFKRRPCPHLNRFPELQRPEVRLAYRESPGRFSKWVYYTEDIDTIDRFDFLIVFDADMGLATFPWEDFFGRYQTYAARRSAAPVTGIVRNSTPFSPLRADWWQDCGRQSVRFVEADFVEQWFAMLSGSFAAWFLRRVVQVGLLTEQKNLGVDWGVDAAWCGAAAEWSGKEAGCLLIPMDMYHGDTKSLKQDITFHQRGEHLNNLWWLRLPQWMKTSEIWLGTFFQDPGITCSPCGVEERYHIPEDLRDAVPIVPSGAPGASLHMEEAEGDDSASGSAYNRIPSRSTAFRLFAASRLVLATIFVVVLVLVH